MAKYSNTVEYNIKTSLDKTGITQLHSELSKLQQQFQVMRNQGLVGKKETQEAIANIKLIQSSLNKAFNGKLGMFDNKAFMSSLAAGGQSIGSIAKSFSAMGAQGTAAFTRMYGQISRIDTGMKQISSASDKIMNTLGNTVRWGLIASAFAGVMNAMHQSVEYVKDLDKSLTNIMMVSGETRDNMNAFAREANQIAQRLGGTTTQMTEATKIFVQQGLSLNQSSKLAEYSVHLANVSEQDSATAADEITAYKNAFKIDLDDLGNAISKWAAVANNAAVSVEELSVASQKAASVAKTVGVDMDQFAAHIAAIESTTREAPENIGNGLKTLYSRISDIKLGETLEDGVNLGQFTGALKKIGVEALDASGEIRNAGEIIEDIMARWQDLSQTQRVATATTVAGRFQLARFNALMNSSDIYQNALKTSRNETGTTTYDRMQETYRDSLEGRMNALTAAIEEIFLNAFNTDEFYGVVDATTALVKAFGDLVEAIGGGSNAFTALTVFLTRTFTTQISRGISNFISNRETSQLATQNKAMVEAQSRMAMQGLYTGNVNADRYVQASGAVYKHAQMLNPEQIRLVNEELVKYEEQLIAVDKLQEEHRQLTLGLGEALVQLGLQEELAQKGALEWVRALEKTDGDLEKTKELLANSGFLKVADEIENAQMHLVQFSDSLIGVSARGEADWTKIQEGAQKLQNEIFIAREQMRGAGQDTVKLSAVADALQRVINGDVTSIEKLQTVLSEGSTELNMFREGIIKVFDNCEQLNSQLQRNTEQLAAVRAAANVTGQSLMGMAVNFDTQYLITQVTHLASAFMSLSFVMMSVRSLFEVWQNEDLDPFEKLEQSIMNLSMIGVMLFPMITQGKETIMALREAMSLIAVQQKINNTLTQEEIAEKEILIKLDTVESQAKTRSALMNEAIAAGNIERAETIGLVCNAILRETQATNQLSLAKLQEIAIKNGLTAVEVKEIAAKLGVTVATDKLTVSTVKFIAAQAAAHPIITAVVVALAALAYGLKLAYDAYYADANAAKEAGKTAQELNKVWKDTKTKADELSNSLEQLEKHEDALNKLTKRSSEWNDELKETNQLVLDILETYPALAQYISRDSDGLLHLSDKGVEEAKKLVEQAEQQTHAQSILASMQANQANLKAEATDLSRATTWTTRKTEKVQSSIPGQYTTQTKTVTNSLTGDQIQALAQYMADNNKATKDLTVKDIEAALNITANTDKIVAAIQDNGADLNKFVEKIKNNETVSDLSVDEALKAYLGDSYDTSNPYIQQLKNSYSQNYIQNRQKYGTDNGLGNITTDELMKKYANLMGWDSNSATIDRKGWGKADDVISFLDEQGKTQELSRKALEQAIASAEALEIAGEEWQTVSASWKDLTNKIGLEEATAATQDYVNNKEITLADGSTIGFADYMRTQGINSLEEFISALNSGSIALENFSNATEKSYSLSDLEYDVEKSQNPLMYQDPNNPLNYEKQLKSMTEAEAEKWDIDVEDIVDQAEVLQDVLESVDKDFKLTEGRARALAVQNQRMAKGLDTLSDKWEDWSDALQDVNKGSVDYIDAAQDLTKCIADLVGAEEDLDLSKEFFDSAENMGYLAQAAEGDIDAVNRLGIAVAQDLVSQMEPLREFSGLDFSDADSEQAWYNMVNSFNQAKDTVIGGLEDLQANLDSIGFGQNVYDQLGGADWVNALNEMAMVTGMSVEQMNSMLNSMGVQADVTTVDVDQDVQVPEYETIETVETLEEPDKETGRPGRYRKTSRTQYMGSKTVPGKVPVAQINTGDATGTPPSINYVGNGGSRRPSGGGGGKSGGGGGGGGGKSNEPKAVKKSADIGESKPAEAENDIYEKVNATLEKLQDNYSTLNKIKDRTWGKEYRDNAQKGLDLLVKEQKTLNKRIDIAKKYADALTTGKSNLEYGIDMTGKESLASLGLTDADADGVIDNYISKFEEARQAARKLDAEAEAYRNKANAEALAYWQSKGGVLDAEGNVVTDASMSDEENEYYTELIEKQKTHYDLLVEKANEQWETAKNINDVTKDYEDTMNQIRDDEEEQLDIAHQIEDIQIDLYQRSLDMLDTMHDINDIAAQMKGFFTKLATDDPFRALTEGAQAFEDSFKDATYDAEAYYDDIIEKLKQEQDQVRANGGDWEKYNEAIAFYNDQKQKALTDADGLGSGELAQASRKLTELDRWIRNPNAVDNPYGTNTQALYDAYKEQYQKVTDAALEAEERMENVHDSILEAYDKMAEQQDEFIQKYDRVDEQLERTSDRVALFKGEDAYADQAAIEEQRAKVALAAGRSNLKILDKYSQQLAKEREKQELKRPKKIADAEKEVNRLQKALNEDKNNLDLQQQLATAKIVLEQAKYDDTEEVKWLQNKVDETSDYINDKADESAEHFKNAYENTIDELAAQTNEKVFGNRDLDLITNDWDWDRDYFGSYKDNVERTLETEKLRLKYLDLLDNAQGMSLGIQRQIKDAMDEQLALLENQKTMSEYDVKLANARLEILQKQIALENAQQNKNQMKLRRDTQGNYKYVYAADQGDVRQKQQELLDAEFDAYEMSKDANGDAYQKGIALYQQYIEQRTAIEKKYANDTDTMEKELAKLRENYLRAANANAEDLQDTYDGMIISVQWMAENGTEAVKQMTEDVLDALETKTQESLEAVGIPWNDAINKALTDLGDEKEGTGLIGAIDDTAQAGIDAAKRFVDAIDGDAKDINDDLGSVKSMVNDLAKSIDGDTAAIQGSFGDIEVSIDKAKQSTIELGAETDQLNQKLGAELGAVDAAKEKIELYEKQLTAAKNSTSALASQLAATQEQLTAQTKEAEHWKTVHENYLQSEADKKAEEERKKEEAKKEADKKTDAKKTGSKNFGIGDTVYYDGKSAGYYTSYKDTPNWTWHNDAGWYEVFNMNNGMTALSTNGGADLWAWVENEHLTKYKTGGYTGIWEGGLDADDGRLAVLHQKELVLNQQDTKNILDAVQIVRSTLDLAKLSSLSPFTFGVGKISQGIGDRIEQRVEITAEFPAANSADDIRQALLGLSDAAMQYAYRER